MRLGVGLPNTLLPQLNRTLLLDWARTAEAAGFSTLGTIDKPNYDSWDPLVTLAAVAAVTERIRLATTILQLPNRNETLVAKQAAVIDQISGGRVSLGVGVGGREDDYAVFGAEMKSRGPRFERQLARIRQVWTDARAAGHDRGVLGPAPVQQPGPPIWIGAMAEKTVERAIRLGDGFLFATTGPDLMAQMTPQVRVGAQAAGKADFTINGICYAGIGNDPRQALNDAAHQVLRYYGQLWTEPENLIHHGPPERIADDLRKYQAAGLDELIVFLEIPDVRQVELLARARELAGL